MLSQPHSSSSASARASGRPGLAILSGVVTPYRVHLHRRLAREIPQFQLHSLFTHMVDGQWQIPPPPEINPVSFARAGDPPYGSRLSGACREWRKGGRMIQYLREHNVRAVISNGFSFPPLLRTLLYCRRAGIAAFVRGDSNIFERQQAGRLKNLGRHVMLRWALRTCRGFMPMGSLGQEYFSSFGIPRERCFWVPYEPDYEFFAQAPADELAEFRQRHNVREDRRYFLYCGRLVGFKNVRSIVAAFMRLAGEVPEWDLVVAGDGPLRGQLQQMVKPEMAHRVHWLGALDAAATRLAYHATDVLVFPSLCEAWGVVVNEALAAGRPVLASHTVGSAADMVQDNVSGFIFQAGSDEAVFDAMRRAADPATLARLRQGTGPSLARWRQVADPVAGVRQALQWAGVLSGS